MVASPGDMGTTEPSLTRTIGELEDQLGLNQGGNAATSLPFSSNNFQRSVAGSPV
jgi:hypothetical protein